MYQGLKGGCVSAWTDRKVSYTNEQIRTAEMRARTMSGNFETYGWTHERSRFQAMLKSSAMQLIRQQIAELAQVDTPVLVEGEPGTCKELVAREIHLLSNRAKKPFVVFQSVGLSEQAMTDQLFGTAARNASPLRTGCFDKADGGTLFLDEVGNLTLSLQAHLARVLKDKRVGRPDQSRWCSMDVRLICATRMNLKREAEEGLFYHDLIYRISVARVSLPPLREQRINIPLLADLYLRESRSKSDKMIEGFSPEVMRVLLAYRWPGNVSELQSVIEYAVLRCKETVISLSDLPPELAQAEMPQGPTSMSGEKDRIQAALRAAKGNRTLAAQFLGMSRATLYRRIHGLGIEVRKQAGDRKKRLM